MRPKELGETRNLGDLFRAPLDQVLTREHPLYVLANQIDGSVFEQEFSSLYVNSFGRPGLPIGSVAGDII